MTPSPSTIAPLAALDPEQTVALVDAVVDAFNLEELERLAYVSLGQRLEVLVNVREAMPTVVSDLVERVRQRGWTEEFVRGVYRARPDNPLVRAFCKTHAPFVFTRPPSTDTLVQLVDTGLGAVAGLLTSDRTPIREAIRQVLLDQAWQSLADLGTQFARLRRYKTLHDCLHNLQFKYARLIVSSLTSFVQSPEQADSLDILFGEMTDDLAEAGLAAEELESCVAEKVWLKVVNESVKRMRSAVKAKDARAAAAGYSMLEGVLRVQPTRINELLTSLLEQLKLDQLRDRLTDLGGEGPFAEATAALGSLTPRLNGILCDHKEWQLVDNTLLQIETDLKLGLGLEPGAFLWSEAEVLLRSILDRDRGAAWSEEVRQLGAALGQAFAASEAEQVKVAFRRLRPRAMWFFYQADRELKELSGELDKVGDKLRQVLGGVGNGSH